MPGAVSISNSASSKANQNHKKKVQILLKKTHFTENEINRLLDLHYHIMVSTTISQITVFGESVYCGFSFTPQNLSNTCIPAECKWRVHLDYDDSLEIPKRQCQTGPKEVSPVPSRELQHHWWCHHGQDIQVLQQELLWRHRSRGVGHGLQCLHKRWKIIKKQVSLTLEWSSVVCGTSGCQPKVV